MLHVVALRPGEILAHPVEHLVQRRDGDWQQTLWEHVAKRTPKDERFFAPREFVLYVSFLWRAPEGDSGSEFEILSAAVITDDPLWQRTGHSFRAFSFDMETVEFEDLDRAIRRSLKKLEPRKAEHDITKPYDWKEIIRKALSEPPKT